MSPAKNDDRPRSLKHQDVRQSRIELAKAPGSRVLLLNRLADAIARRTNSDVPWFDPLDGGERARILFLLESPGPKARKSGFVSINNDDATAEWTWRLWKNIRLKRTDAVIWNAVSWFLPAVGGKASFRAPSSGELEIGVKDLARVLKRCPKLQIVVLQGKKAQAAWCIAQRTKPKQFQLPSICCPHPAAQNVNSRKEAAGEIRECLREAMRKARLTRARTA